MEKTQERDLVDPVFSTRNFLRTLSYREFVTSLSLALLLLALYTTLDYYSDEGWIQNNDLLIRSSLFSLLILVNHIFYKVEHKRPNNFIGRNFHDYFFLLFVLAISQLKLFLLGSNLSLRVEGVMSVVLYLLLFIFAVALFELAVAILKRGLKLFRCEVL